MPRHARAPVRAVRAPARTVRRVDGFRAPAAGGCSRSSPSVRSCACGGSGARGSATTRRSPRWRGACRSGRCSPTSARRTRTRRSTTCSTCRSRGSAPGSSCTGCRRRCARSPRWDCSRGGCATAVARASSPPSSSPSAGSWCCTDEWRAGYAELELLGVAIVVLADAWLRRPRRAPRPAARALVVPRPDDPRLGVPARRGPASSSPDSGAIVTRGAGAPRSSRPGWAGRRSGGARSSCRAAVATPTGSPGRLRPGSSTRSRASTTGSGVLAVVVVGAVVAGGVLLLRRDRIVAHLWWTLFGGMVALAALAGLALPVLLDRTLTLVAWGPALALGRAGRRALDARSPLAVVASIAILAALVVPTFGVLTDHTGVTTGFDRLTAVVRPGDVAAVRPVGKFPELQWNVGVRGPAPWRPVNVAGLTQVAGVALLGAPPSGRVWVLDWNSRLVHTPGYARCAPDWRFGRSRVVCLRAHGVSRWPSHPRRRVRRTSPFDPIDERGAREWATGARSRSRHGRANSAPRATPSPTSRRARREQVVGVALGARRRVHAVAAPHRRAPPSPPGARGEAAPDRGAERGRHHAHRRAQRGGLPRGGRRPLRGRRRPRPTSRCASPTPIPPWCDSSAPGCAASSRSTKPVCGFACTCTRDSTSTPPNASGPEITGIPRAQFRKAVPRRGRPDDPAQRARARVCVRAVLLDRRSIAGSWGWCGRC